MCRPVVELGVTVTLTTSQVPVGQAINLNQITKRWGDSTALDDVSLDIVPGAFTALLGPSGCGKSTALRVISGLEAVTSGRVFIGGQDVTYKEPAQRDIAMVFQSYALFPHLSVAENIIFGLRVRGMARGERDEKLRSSADILGLSQLLDRKPSQLSGGQQQRVALGRAIVADKSIFLMDEPLSNLDAKLRAEMRDEIRSLQRHLGVTMVYVTHDQVEAVTMADQVVLMNGGKIEQVATPREIYERPETLFAAKFIGMPPMVAFTPTVFGDELAKQASDFVYGIRPEAIRPDENGQLSGVVDHAEYLGADTMVRCRIADQTITFRASGQMTFDDGAPIRLGFNRHDLHVFSASDGHRIDSIPSDFEPLLAAQDTSQKPAKRVANKR